MIIIIVMASCPGRSGYPRTALRETIDVSAIMLQDTRIYINIRGSTFLTDFLCNY